MLVYGAERFSMDYRVSLSDLCPALCSYVQAQVAVDLGILKVAQHSTAQQVLCLVGLTGPWVGVHTAEQILWLPGAWRQRQTQNQPHPNDPCQWVSVDIGT